MQEDSDLRRWLHDSVQGRFVIAWFQPIVDIRTRGVVGFEALARAWRNGAAVPPGVFIALAKEEQLIDQLGEIVVDYALHQAGRLPGDSTQLGINFSTKQLTEPAMVSRILQAVELRNFERRRLVVEVSEQDLSEAGESVFAALTRLRTAGCQIVVDDFSARWLSIESIVAMGVSGVKISRRVVDAVVENATAASLVQNVCSVAHEHMVQATAVGVEDAEQMNLLRTLGCDRVQGFFTGRPLPIDEASSLRERGDW